MAVPFFQTTGAGTFCFPINITSSGAPGIQDGANVTIQVIFDGGDGSLYQVNFALQFITRFLTGLMELPVCGLDAICYRDASK